MAQSAAAAAAAAGGGVPDLPNLVRNCHLPPNFIDGCKPQPGGLDETLLVQCDEGNICYNEEALLWHIRKRELWGLPITWPNNDEEMSDKDRATLYRYMCDTDNKNWSEDQKLLHRQACNQQSENWGKRIVHRRQQAADTELQRCFEMARPHLEAMQARIDGLQAEHTHMLAEQSQQLALVCESEKSRLKKDAEEAIKSWEDARNNDYASYKQYVTQVEQALQDTTTRYATELAACRSQQNQMAIERIALQSRNEAAEAALAERYRGSEELQTLALQHRRELQELQQQAQQVLFQRDQQAQQQLIQKEQDLQQTLFQKQQEARAEMANLQETHRLQQQRATAELTELQRRLQDRERLLHHLQETAEQNTQQVHELEQRLQRQQAQCPVPQKSVVPETFNIPSPRKGPGGGGAREPRSISPDRPPPSAPSLPFNIFVHVPGPQGSVVSFASDFEERPQVGQSWRLRQISPRQISPTTPPASSGPSAALEPSKGSHIGAGVASGGAASGGIVSAGAASAGIVSGGSGGGGGRGRGRGSPREQTVAAAQVVPMFVSSSASQPSGRGSGRGVATVPAVAPVATPVVAAAPAPAAAVVPATSALFFNPFAAPGPAPSAHRPAGRGRGRGRGRGGGGGGGLQRDDEPASELEARREWQDTLAAAAAARVAAAKQADEEALKQGAKRAPEPAAAPLQPLIERSGQATVIVAGEEKPFVRAVRRATMVPPAGDAAFILGALPKPTERGAAMGRGRKQDR